MKQWLVLLAFIFLVSCNPTNKTEKAYSDVVGLPEPAFTPSEPTTPDCSSSLIEVVGSLANMPSPNSNLKYVTQTSNLFEVKYGDGIYRLMSKQTSPIRISCISGDSMLPTFDCDDWLILKDVENSNEVEIGDIILFRSNEGLLIIHRVFKIENNKYQTKADNLGSVVIMNNKIISSDNWIDFNRIIAKVVGIIYK